jgi:hypothetical protein
VFDDICALVSSHEDFHGPEYTTERIFKRIYDWLTASIKGPSLKPLEELATMFEPFIVK